MVCFYCLFRTLDIADHYLLEKLFNPIFLCELIASGFPPARTAGGWTIAQRVLHLTVASSRRCPSPNKQTRSVCRARAMWVRRALQRAEPERPIGFQGLSAGGFVRRWIGAILNTFLFEHRTP